MDPKPHVVCIPAPIQGHVKPMLNLAKLLFHKGCHVTFVNTYTTHRSLLESRGSDALDGVPGFRFESISDDFPSSAADEPPPVKTQRLLAPFRDLVAKLNDGTATSDVPRVSCIVSDGFILFTLDVAEELGVPIALFFTVSASAMMGMMQFPALRDRGFTPLEDETYLENGYLDTVIDWIPGMNDIRLRDLQSFIRTTNPNDAMLEFGIETSTKAAKASTIILLTFQELEQNVLDALSTILPQVRAIGPLHLLLNKLPEDPLKCTGYNLWKEDTECLRWLDSKPPNSVMYVNFGSLTVMTLEQVIEFGWGLANSKHPFLWIIRPGLVTGDSLVLPRELVECTKERSMVTSWCPQEKVLNHVSVGGFLTHSGWNSTIESMAAGVPMICWPNYADQYTNCRFACEEWGVGMEIDNDVKRGQVEELVRELMEGEKGREMRRKAMEWKGKAEESTNEGGSSFVALDRLVGEDLIPKEEIISKK